MDTVLFLFCDAVAGKLPNGCHEFTAELATISSGTFDVWKSVLQDHDSKRDDFYMMFAFNEPYSWSTYVESYAFTDDHEDIFGFDIARKYQHIVEVDFISGDSGSSYQCSFEEMKDRAKKSVPFTDCARFTFNPSRDIEESALIAMLSFWSETGFREIRFDSYQRPLEDFLRRQMQLGQLDWLQLRGPGLSNELMDQIKEYACSEGTLRFLNFYFNDPQTAFDFSFFANIYDTLVPGKRNFYAAAFIVDYEELRKFRKEEFNPHPAHDVPCTLELENGELVEGMKYDQCGKYVWKQKNGFYVNFTREEGEFDSLGKAPQMWTIYLSDCLLNCKCQFECLELDEVESSNEEEEEPDNDND